MECKLGKGEKKTHEVYESFQLDEDLKYERERNKVMVEKLNA